MMDDVPGIGPMQGKLWGNTQLVFSWNDTDAWWLRGLKGHRCSRHYHVHKWNRFFVVAGQLKITTYLDNGTVDETLLGPNQIADVAPGVEHSFEVMEDTLAIEFYWVGLAAGDIVRIDEGGPVQ